jgi:outer membrane lipoprotein SlyB
MSKHTRSILSRELAIAAALAAALAGPALAGNAAGGNLGVGQAPVGGGAGGAPAGNPNAEGPRAPINPSSIIGRITSVNLAERTLVFDNGQTYQIAANLDVGTITPGQTVTLTLETAGDRPTVTKVTPNN